MKTTIKTLLLTLILAPVLVLGQGKIVLINGDTVSANVKKLSGTVVTIEQDGLEQEVNLLFVNQIYSNAGKQVASKDNGLVDYVNASEKKGRTLQLEHTVALEQEADNLFSKAKKYQIGWVPNGKIDISAYTNSFLTLSKKDGFVVYVNGYTDFTSIIGRFYKLIDVKVLLGSVTPEREYRWTGYFENDSDIKLELKGGEIFPMKYQFKNNELIFLNPQSKDPLVFNIAYMDENTIRYFSAPDKYTFVVKTLQRVKVDQATVSK